MSDKKSASSASSSHRDPPPPSGTAESTAPGKEPEKAAASGAEAKTPPGLAPLGQGAQVVLTGDAAAAARGGLHDEIEHNTAARDAAILAGHVAPGTTEEAAKGAVTTHAAHPGHPAHQDD